MGHKRVRYLRSNLKKILGFSPLVGILGHRQVGKTTLLEEICSEYYTLDDKETTLSIEKNPKKFLEAHSNLKTGIDECQLIPDLFPALKEKVRRDKRPGQYILSGSVRFTSRKAIRESLTGRIVNLELLPFTISEIHHMERPQSIKNILESSNLERSVEFLKGEISLRKKLDKEIDLYLIYGGLPGVFFVRDKTLREARIADQLVTMLDRDLRLVYPTTIPYSQLFDYVQYLAQNEGGVLRYSDIQKEVGLSSATQKKLLYALEAIFLIRIIPIDAGEKGHIVYFEDQAESLYLDKVKSQQIQMEGFIYRQIRQEFYYELGKSFRFFHYSTRGGARVPIAVESEGSTIGFIPVFEEKPTRSQMATADSFLKTFNRSKIIFLKRGLHAEVLSSRAAILPYILFC